jgi:hypothetical protein
MNNVVAPFEMAPVNFVETWVKEEFLNAEEHQHWDVAW